MITEIVKFAIPEGMSGEDVIAGFEATADSWKANPDLIRKNGSSPNRVGNNHLAAA